MTPVAPPTAAAEAALPTAAAPAGGARPLSQVLAAFRDGAVSLDQIAVRTGLPGTIVRTSVAHLIRMGRIEAHEMSTSCAGGSCASCAVAHEDGSPCELGPSAASFQTPGAGGRRVLVQLSLRR